MNVLNVLDFNTIKIYHPTLVYIHFLIWQPAYGATAMSYKCSIFSTQNCVLQQHLTIFTIHNYNRKYCGKHFGKPGPFTWMRRLQSQPSASAVPRLDGYGSFQMVVATWRATEATGWRRRAGDSNSRQATKWMRGGSVRSVFSIISESTRRAMPLRLLSPILNMYKISWQKNINK